jgi:hypothetical protein
LKAEFDKGTVPEGWLEVLWLNFSKDQGSRLEVAGDVGSIKVRSLHYRGLILTVTI